MSAYGTQSKSLSRPMSALRQTSKPGRLLTTLSGHSRRRSKDRGSPSSPIGASVARRRRGFPSAARTALVPSRHVPKRCAGAGLRGRPLAGQQDSGRRPACPSRASGWSSIDHALGLPVFRALSLCTCCRHYPGAASGRTASLTSPSRVSLPRKGHRVGLRIVLFEACSAFTRVAACTLALSPIRDTHSEGFSHFVASMTAPVASGWSGCRVGLAPTGKRPLVTAHTRTGPSRSGMASHRLC